MKKGIAFVLTVVLLATLATGCASSMTVAEPTIEPVLSATAEPTVQQDAAQEEAVSIVDAKVNENGELILYMSNNTTINAGLVRGEDGKDGVDGLNGADGKDGVNGKNGRDGVDGKDGADGKDGRDGIDGTNGRDGVDGKNGKDGADGKGDKGDKGDSGLTPSIGENGNWFIDGKDTGVHAGKKITENSYFTVTYVLGEGWLPDNDKDKINISVKAMEKINDMPVPNSNDSKYFVGWFNGNEQFTPDSPVCENLVLVAKYAVPHPDENGFVIEGDTLFKCLSVGSNVVVPEGVTRIAAGAFSSNFIIKNIELPDTVTTIGTSAFAYCDELESIHLSKNITSIGAEAFRECSKLKNIDLPENLTTIKRGTFRDCYRIEKINLPDTVTAIEADAFSDCASLESIHVPEGLIRIGDNAFDGCKKLTSFAFPSTLKYIGECAFSNCSGLETVELNEGLTEMGSGPFESCEKLKKISLPSTLERIPQGAFQDCRALRDIEWKEGVKVIDYNAFLGAELENLILPDSVELIGGQAFYGVTGNVVLGENIRWIGWSAFSGVTESVSFEKCKQLQIIGREAFFANYFSKIILPSTVIEIGENAFVSNNAGTLEIYCDAKNPPAIESSTFGYLKENGSRPLKVFVVSGSEEAYKAANYWKDAVSIEAYK